MITIFCLSLSILVYVYIGYPLLVWGLARLFGREPHRDDVTPSVTLLIPAYNEEAHLEAKLKNSLALDYPKDRLTIVVVDDGSTDRTDEIATRFRSQGVVLRSMREHVGKTAMLLRVVPLLRDEVVVFSDASSELESAALRQLVRSFADPRVGAVSGLYRLKISGDLRGQGEGLYWRYEAFIKRQESALDSILGAHGAFYAIRRERFQPIDGTMVNDDYLIPMRIVAAGFRAVYEPEAVAWEREAASVEGEFARRRRIAVGNCQQIAELHRMLNPFTRGWVAFCFFSHKVLRTIAPFFMLSLFFSSAWLPQPIAGALVSLQALFYASALAGYVCQRRGLTIQWLSPPFYFCLGNLAMLAGLLKFCFSRQPLAWERSR
jgi:cellulose synthase/poly-beta-1,6-N-acetylglucosamine synthase-like glycosyltransferase